MIRYRTFTIAGHRAGLAGAAARRRHARPRASRTRRASVARRYQESRQGPEQTERVFRDLQGRRRRVARPESHRRRRARHHRRNNGSDRGDQARAPSRIPTRPSVCSAVAHRGDPGRQRVEVRTFYPRTTAARWPLGQVDYTIAVPVSAAVDEDHLRAMWRSPGCAARFARKASAAMSTCGARPIWRSRRRSPATSRADIGRVELMLSRSAARSSPPP